MTSQNSWKQIIIHNLTSKKQSIQRMLKIQTFQKSSFLRLLLLQTHKSKLIELIKQQHISALREYKNDNVQNFNNFFFLLTILQKTIIYRIKKIQLNINNPNKIDMIQQLYTQTNQMLKEVIKSKDQEIRRLQKIIIDLQNKDNSISVKDKPYRTTILLDATVSMNYLINIVLAAMDSVIRCINQIKSMHPTITSSQIQIGVYRNYNSTFDEIFKCTQFESQSKNLLNFIRSVSASGGMGNQAIQVALNYINQRSMADQIIIIGDAPGNSSSEIVQKRKIKGQQYWNFYGLPILSPDKLIFKNQLNQQKVLPNNSVNFIRNLKKFKI